MKTFHFPSQLFLLVLTSGLILNGVAFAADAPAATASTVAATSSAASTDQPAAASVNPTIVPVVRTPLGGFMDFHNRYVARAKQGDIDVLYIGDSIVNQFQVANIGKDVWDKYYGSLKAADFGHNGDAIQHILWRIQNGEGEGFTPKVVVLMEGTNNLSANSIPEIVEGITFTVKDLRTRWPSTRILLLGILPNGRASTPASPGRIKISTINQSLSKLEDGKHIFYFDLGPHILEADGTISSAILSDGTHPTAAGYTLWAEALKEPIDNLLHGKDVYGFPILGETSAATTTSIK